MTTETQLTVEEVYQLYRDMERKLVEQQEQILKNAQWIKFLLELQSREAQTCN